MKPATRAARPTSLARSKQPRAKRSPAHARVKFVEPMKARAVATLPAGDWCYEIKFDGYRAIAVIDHGEVQLWSRNAKRWTDRFGAVRAALAKLALRDAVLDGEIVALDEHGRSSFQKLQNAERALEAPPIRYYLFDLLRLDGADWKTRPLAERQAALAKLLRRPPEGLALSPVFPGPAERLMAAVRQQGLEGVIAKAAGSRYEPGQRSGAWLKCRLAREQEFVIGGYTPPGGSRLFFGAILVGTYDAEGQLRYAGKVGTGFDTRWLERLHECFQRRTRRTCPFVDLPRPKKPRFGLGMTPAVMRTVTWLKPELVAQIRFAEWTDDGLLRQPVFLGLRTDKAAKDVVREALAAEAAGQE